MNQIWLAFITGLTTGGISCIAVQGGLLTTSLAQKDKLSANKNVVVFLLAKLIAYAVLGFGLGLLGSRISISPTVQGWMQIIAGLYMLATAANLLDLHPIFRYVIIQPPMRVYKYMRVKSKHDSIFTPALLGMLTVFIPCGITQGMMILAVASGSAWLGSAILAFFVLGTSPVFFVLGVISSKLIENKSLRFASALLIVSLGLISLNTGQALRGSVHTFQNYTSTLGIANSNTEKNSEVIDGVQEVVINVETYGYKSSAQTLYVDIPVRLSLITNRTQGCARAFTIPSLKFSKVLPETGKEVIEFTPTETGIIAYTCSMGMYTGNFRVVEKT